MARSPAIAAPAKGGDEFVKGDFNEFVAPLNTDVFLAIFCSLFFFDRAMTLTLARIAVLLTCFNRKAKTLHCLERLFAQQGLDAHQLDTYLVDDGSTDGTGEAVQATYPQVKILTGDGNLFWNGGMHRAMAAAMAADYEAYLWLNDDTLLDPDAVATLLHTAQFLAQCGFREAIVAGSTRDPETGAFTYGGMRQVSPLLPPFKVRPVLPGSKPRSCDTICGNVVLIPRQVVQKIGNLDRELTHYAGDWDYGLRAKQAGCTVWIAPGYQGTCADNPRPAANQPVALTESLTKIQQPKGLMLADVTLHPWAEWQRLMRRHGGPLWVIYWLLPYRRLWWHALRERFTTASKTV